ncbi:hypothetical protein TOPH_01374 [Tolypocladium ophioglossoides CBS 100239]|uniref:Uncharacterized protein n=1 Tax=Tolypocladium ophioglossoides (strain CBS 100239) TaxID=1163406 RepID=A0A0L0NHW9_TOLOC|nr:hypothetical protein TOPH_01374 [Tolypocladium ophioglossoides CBS 100239]
MAIPRSSSGMLRSHIRPAARNAPPRIRAAQQQKPPPPNPGGPEAIRRNWVPLGGAALLFVAMYAYLTRTPPKAATMPQPEAAEAKQARPSKLPPIKEEGRRDGLAKRLEDKESTALSQLSGRKKSEFGAFRAE